MASQFLREWWSLWPTATARPHTRTMSYTFETLLHRRRHRWQVRIRRPFLPSRHPEKVRCPQRPPMAAVVPPVPARGSAIPTYRGASTSNSATSTFPGWVGHYLQGEVRSPSRPFQTFSTRSCNGESASDISRGTSSPLPWRLAASQMSCIMVGSSVEVLVYFQGLFLYNILMSPKVPYRFNGLEGIGVFFFLFNLALYVLCIVLIACRFIRYPETFKASFLHPTESLFMPSAVVSFATVLLNILQYGLFHTGPWLNEAAIVLFWIFVVLAITTSSTIYLLLYGSPQHQHLCAGTDHSCYAAGPLKPSPLPP